MANKVTGVTHTLQDSYAYDADGSLLSLTQSDLTGGDATRMTSYTYNDHGEVASVTQPGGATSGGGSQSEGASSANPAGATTGYSYNDSGKVSAMTDPNGNEYDNTYNEYGGSRPDHTDGQLDQLAGPGGGSSLVLDSYAYDQAGLLGPVTDAMGRTTEYSTTETWSWCRRPDAASVGHWPETTYSYDGGEPGRDRCQQRSGHRGGPEHHQLRLGRGGPADQHGVGRAPSGPAAADTQPDHQLHLQRRQPGHRADHHRRNGPATTDYGYNAADELTSQSVVNGRWMTPHLGVRPAGPASCR